MRNRLTLGFGMLVVLALVAGSAVVAVRWWHESHRTPLQQAMAMAPGDGERFSWTEWSAVRRELGAELSIDSSTTQINDFLARGFDADLTSTSALVDSAPVLQVQYGFSPASADWELFSQGASGAVVMLGMPGSTDFDALADQLRRLGYTAPEDDTGIWLGGEDVLTRIGAGAADVTPELSYIALDAEDGLILTSDSAGFLRQAVHDAAGEGATPGGLQEVVDSSGEPLSAAIYVGDYACSVLAMSGADQSDQDRAAELIEAAGKVNPVTGFAMSVQPDLHIRVALSFENDDQARTNADSRAALASGPAIGQGGEFSDRFTVASVSADGPVVTMDLEPVQDSYVLSDLSTGPVLFATC